MSWFNHNGVWIRVVDGRPSDVKDQLRDALLDLQHLKAINPHEIKTMTKPGKWRITSQFGRDVIEMTVGPGPAPKTRPTQRFVPLTRYVPAFHAFDDTETFVGLVLCLAGKWGPPYKFIACNEEDILNFDWGLWNWEEDPEVPPEDENIETLITVEYEGAPINPDTGQPLPDKHYFDVPANHTYCTQTTQVDYQTGGSAGTLVGSEIINVMCTAQEAHVYEMGMFTWSDWWRYVNALVVMVDWSQYAEDQPQLTTWTRGYDRAGTYTGHGGTSSVWIPTPPPNACEVARANVAEGGTTWTSLLSGYSTSLGLNLHTVWYKDWDVTRIGFGENPISTTDWSTFDSQRYDDGAFFYGATVSDGYGLWEWGYGDTWVAVFDNFYGDDGSETIGALTGQDYIVVFGEKYPLRSFAHAYGYYSTELALCFPRIYKLGDSSTGDPRWCLASSCRRDRTEWEYMCFQPDASPAIAQYNDPEANFDLVDGTWPYWHEIPITGSVDGQEKQLYGKGYFSLVRIYEPHGLVYDGEEPDTT